MRAVSGEVGRGTLHFLDPAALCSFRADDREAKRVSLYAHRHLGRGTGRGGRPDQLRLTPDERADLVAYVDGELPETHSRSIATKLTQSATARREVEMLEKTWEMLDYLPRPRVTEQFSEKTVSHIRRLELGGSRGNRPSPPGPRGWAGPWCTS